MTVAVDASDVTGIEALAHFSFISLENISFVQMKINFKIFSLFQSLNTYDMNAASSFYICLFTGFSGIQQTLGFLRMRRDLLQLS